MKHLLQTVQLILHFDSVPIINFNASINIYEIATELFSVTVYGYRASR